MLCLDPSKRITAAEALEHPWFKENMGNANVLPCLLPKESRNEGFVKRKREEYLQIQQQQQKKRKSLSSSYDYCAEEPPAKRTKVK